MVYAVVMAGGKERDFGLKVENMPKQLWEILDGKSLLQNTVERGFYYLQSRAPVITGEHLYQPICEQLPQCRRTTSLWWNPWDAAQRLALV